MVMRIYCVYDVVAKESGPLFTAKNIQVAQRMFNQMLKDVGAESEDFRLVHLGLYDNEVPVISVDPECFMDQLDEEEL